MLRQAVAHQVPFRWVTADSIYGDYRSLRLWLESLPKPYVLAVSRKETVVMRLAAAPGRRVVGCAAPRRLAAAECGRRSQGTQALRLVLDALDGPFGRGLETLAAGAAQHQRSQPSWRPMSALRRRARR